MSALDSRAALPIRLSGVSVRLAATTLLDDISLAIAAGPPTVIVGPNGAGKTLLLKTAMGLITPTHGEVTWGSSRTPPAAALAFVFQRPVMLRRSCADNLRYALAASEVSPRDRDAQVLDLLRKVGLTDRAQRPARQLSGGEQQRLALARALARRPSVLFLDEPTASLDPGATKSVEDLVCAVSDQGVKVVMATHDLGEARRLAGEIVLLHRGAIIETRPAGEFFREPRSDAAKRFIAGELLL